ncbi:MAG: hypothetical protein EOO88_01180 [Pedobacter sp.]|nr:MAG: hypothetical protein EOO88_01180 [Pedobacter sp.]
MHRSNWTDDKIIHRLLHNKSQTTYWDNIRELRTRASPGLYNECLKLCASRIAVRRILGIDISAQLGGAARPFGKQFRELYFRMLAGEKNQDVVSSLLYAIGHNNNKLTRSRLAALGSFTASRNAAVRTALAYAVGTYKNPVAYSILMKLAHDPSPATRDWAVFFLAQGGGATKAIRETLILKAKDINSDVRMEAIVGLAKRGEVLAKELVDAELGKGEFGSLVFDAVSKLQDISYLPKLKVILKRVRKENDINFKWKSDLKRAIEELESIDTTSKR